MNQATSQAGRVANFVDSSGKRGARQQLNRQRILAAAVACFKTRDPAKTTMEDIAKEARLDRKTVYRTFANRTALLDAIAIQRISEVVGRVKAAVDACPSLDTAIVKGATLSLRLLRKDQIFMSVVKNANDRGVELYLIDPKSPVLESMLSVWREAFSRARARGELRSDLDNTEIANWLRGVHFLLLLREDLSAKGQEALLRKFVLPALTGASLRLV